MNAPIEAKQFLSLERLLMNFDIDSEITRIKLREYSTYKLLETANKLYDLGEIEEDVLLYIAYKHYIKMKNSNISTKYINEFIQMYPGVENYQKK